MSADYKIEVTKAMPNTMLICSDAQVLLVIVLDSHTSKIKQAIRHKFSNTVLIRCDQISRTEVTISV